jgi:hypothetical protein
MREYELGSIVAERILTVEGNPSVQIRALMGTPRIEAGNGDYLCPIQILGLGDEKVWGVHGVDAFQAMQLGMEMIGIELYVKLNRKLDGKIRWNDQLDLGFPLPDSVIEFGPEPPRNDS